MAKTQKPDIKEKVAKLERELGGVQWKRLQVEAQMNLLNGQQKTLTEEMTKIANQITQASAKG